MIRIKMLAQGWQCKYPVSLPDENGNPSGRVTDSSWYISTASDININVYDIYWAIREDYDPQGAEKEDGYQIYDWENPTAVICDGRDVAGDIILIW